eukprot:TRINITY_DN74473_c0_g1_i1.p1 TRINITY_DN74473_c0_g1~~TRINITY_DN74473_c0_g1_i1.p1  ORF type:complete len:521 (-),score=58.52 TRINITY_DN74473_c0_g1_i1:109-1671(-)
MSQCWLFPTLRRATLIAYFVFWMCASAIKCDVDGLDSNCPVAVSLGDNVEVKFVRNDEVELSHLGISRNARSMLQTKKTASISAGTPKQNTTSPSHEQAMVESVVIHSTAEPHYERGHSLLLDSRRVHAEDGLAGRTIALTFMLMSPSVCVFIYWFAHLQTTDSEALGAESGARAVAQSSSNGVTDKPGMARDAMFEGTDESTVNGQDQNSNWLGFIAVAFYIALLIIVDTLASHIAQQSGGSFKWDPASVVLLVESTKCVVSLGLLFWMPGGDATPSSTKVLEAAMRLAPVAALFAANNCLVLYVLSKMQLSSFVVWRNSGIVFNAVIWVAHFRRPLGVLKCVGVLCLLVGLVISDIQVDGIFAVPDSRVLLILLSALCSAVASVLNESVLKGPVGTQTLGINRLNTILYGETTVILLLALAWQSSGSPMRALHDLDYRAGNLVAGQVVLGLCVSRVLVYTDSVTKVMAGGIRELLTLLIAPLFVKSRTDWTSRVAGIYVFLAVVAYFVPPKASDGATS